jgi:hypothetical protein
MTLVGVGVRRSGRGSAGQSRRSSHTRSPPTATSAARGQGASDLCSEVMNRNAEVPMGQRSTSCRGASDSAPGFFRPRPHGKVVDRRGSRSTLSDWRCQSEILRLAFSSSELPRRSTAGACLQRQALARSESPQRRRSERRRSASRARPSREGRAVGGDRECLQGRSTSAAS